MADFAVHALLGVALAPIYPLVMHDTPARFGPELGARLAQLQEQLYAEYRRLHDYFGRGDNLRHPLYIEEMVDAFILAGEASGLNGRIFNVGGPEIMPLREMVETFARGAKLPNPTLHLPMSLGYLAGLAAELAFHVVWVVLNVGVVPGVHRQCLHPQFAIGLHRRSSLL